MAVKIYWLYTVNNNHKIGIMARPRGNEWLDDEINSIKNQGVGVLVSLLEKHEVRELGLLQEADVCKKHAVQFFSFPIEDRKIPLKGLQTIQFLNTLCSCLEAGQNVVIHCRMGIGRSSIIAGAIMMSFGASPKHLIQHISEIRGLKVPDTLQQVDWLMRQKQ